MTRRDFGAFAHVCWISRNLNLSGRRVQVGFAKPLCALLRPFCGHSGRAHAERSRSAGLLGIQAVGAADQRSRVRRQARGPGRSTARSRGARGGAGLDRAQARKRERRGLQATEHGAQRRTRESSLSAQAASLQRRSTVDEDCRLTRAELANDLRLKRKLLNTAVQPRHSSPVALVCIQARLPGCGKRSLGAQRLERNAPSAKR
jgi:hypothetical protein